jgi:hypothetical protein
VRLEADPGGEIVVATWPMSVLVRESESIATETPGVGFASRGGRRAGHAARSGLARSGPFETVDMLLYYFVSEAG